MRKTTGLLLAVLLACFAIGCGPKDDAELPPADNAAGGPKYDTGTANSDGAARAPQKPDGAAVSDQ